jgi:predicted amidohydrolase YtcJ
MQSFLAEIKIPPAAIKKVRVEAGYIGGKLVYGGMGLK